MKNKLSPLPVYEFALFANDVMVAFGAFVLGFWFTGSTVFHNDVPGTVISLAILSLTVISFFRTYHLYSYHFLFSQKEHLKNLVKSFFWGLLTLGIILFLFSSPSLLESNFRIFTFTTLSGAVLLLFLSRYLWDHFLDFLMALGIAFLIIGMAGLFCEENIPAIMTDIGLLFSCFLLAVMLLTVNRIFLVHVVFNNWLRRRFRRQVVIVGSNNEADKIARHIVDHNAPFWIIGTIGPQLPPDMEEKLRKRCLGKIEKLPAIASRLEIDDIIITDENIDKPTLVSILDFCTSSKIDAWFSPKSLPIINIKLRPDNFCGLPMILLGSQKNTWLFDKIKHTLDALVTLPFFIIQLPVFLIIMLAIKLDSEGPIFYRAQAIGKDGNIFSMFKFRSMRADTDNEIHKNYVSKLIKGEIGTDEKEETPLKITNDPRVTKVGRILRKFSLDELPQLINVLKGDMSLVGPRPCLPYEFEMYQDWCKKRTAVRAGITGLWQITGRSEVSFEDMILLDLYYTYNRSVSLDFNILFETIFVVLGKKGAY